MSIAVIVSGASGVVYAERLLQFLLRNGHDVTVLVTDPARLVIAHERGAAIGERDQLAAVEDWLGLGHVEGESAPQVRVAYTWDLMDPLCSGSDGPDAVVVVPCSMAMLSGIAVGRADDLAFRAADVMLKERRPLVLVPRESPLSLIHLKNLVAVAEAGAIVVPAMPGFYHDPETIDDLVDHVVGKVLDQLGIENHLFRRWGEEA